MLKSEPAGAGPSGALHCQQEEARFRPAPFTVPDSLGDTRARGCDPARHPITCVVELRLVLFLDRVVLYTSLRGSGAES